jgi:hypothetical protein
MFTDGSGRLYYKLLGDRNLYQRAFSADSGIVHDDRVATGTAAAGHHRRVLLRRQPLLRDPGGREPVQGRVLRRHRVRLADRGQRPVVDGVDWRARALFLGRLVAANTRRPRWRRSPAPG